MAVEDLRSVKALAGELQHVPVTESALRWYIYKSEENGLEAAVIRRGGRVLIDKPAFERWMFTGNAATG